MKTLSVIGVLALSVLLTLTVVGCNSAQFNKVVTIVNQQLPAVVALGEDIAILVSKPSLGPEFVKIGNIISADLPVFQRAVSAYVANKSTSTKQAIFAAVQSFTSDVNAQFLAVNTIENQNSQQAVLTKLAVFTASVNAFELVLAPFFNGQAQAKADFQKVQPYINRDIQQAVAANYGTTLEAWGL